MHLNITDGQINPVIGGGGGGGGGGEGWGGEG